MQNNIRICVGLLEICIYCFGIKKILSGAEIETSGRIKHRTKLKNNRNISWPIAIVLMIAGNVGRNFTGLISTV